MQPNAPPSPQNQYDFITNPQQQQSSSLMPKLPKGNRRIFFIAGGLLGFVAIVFLVLTILSSGDPTQEQIATIAARQQEIVRVSDIATKEARDSDTLIYAATIKASVQSQQNRLLAVAATKPNSKILSSKRSEATDKRLETAGQANRFDEAYLEYISKELQTYQQELQTLNGMVQLEKTKTVLRDSFSSNGLLLQRLTLL